MTEKMNKGRTKLDNKIGEGREGKGREGKGREGKGREGKWETKMCKRYGRD